jgi:hypothetical protein
LLNPPFVQQNFTNISIAEKWQLSSPSRLLEKFQVCGSVHPQWQYWIKQQLDALLI